MIKTTVIIPYKDNPAALLRAVNSALNQTVPVKIIVIDDHSVDETKASVVLDDDAFQTVEVIYNEINVGGGASRNKGILAANTEYVAFLDCDDYWDSNKIEAQENKIKCYECPVVIFNSIKVVDENRHVIKEYNNDVEVKDFSAFVFLDNGLIQTSALFLPTSLAKSNLFDETLKRHQDYDFCLKLQASGAKFIGCRDVYSYWVISNDPLAAVKKGYDFSVSINFYKNYRELMSPLAGYTFLAKVPFWFCYKQKKLLPFIAQLYKTSGITTVIMMFIMLIRLVLIKRPA